MQATAHFSLPPVGGIEPECSITERWAWWGAGAVEEPDSLFHSQLSNVAGCTANLQERPISPCSKRETHNTISYSNGGTCSPSQICKWRSPPLTLASQGGKSCAQQQQLLHSIYTTSVASFFFHYSLALLRNAPSSLLRRWAFPFFFYPTKSCRGFPQDGQRLALGDWMPWFIRMPKCWTPCALMCGLAAAATQRL